MPQRALAGLGLIPQLIFNSIAVALLVTAPALSPADAELDRGQAVIALNDSLTAVQLAPQLPLVVAFNDRMGAAEFATLPQPLAIGGAPQMSGYRTGDVAYLAAEQSLVVFLSDGTAVPETGLVLVGRMTSGLGDLAGCTRDCATHLVADIGIADEQTD
jgi:hypothetical protein